MKKYNPLFLWLLVIWLTFPITLLVFAYQFMWFSNVVVPFERWVIAAIGTILGSFLFIEGSFRYKK